MISLPRIAFDHRPIKMTIEGKQKKKTPFKFEFMWMDHPKFKANIKEWWEFKVRGTAMYRLSQKISEVKRRIKKQNKEMFRNVEDKKLDLEEELELL